MGYLDKKTVAKPLKAQEAKNVNILKTEEMLRNAKDSEIAVQGNGSLDMIEDTRLQARASERLEQKKRTLPIDIARPEHASKRSRTSQMSTVPIAHEAMARINSSEKCRAALLDAQINEFPEIFVESKDNGKRVPHLGRDAVNICSRDRSLATTGHIPQGPKYWGRTFLYLPGSKDLAVLDNFGDIQNNSASLSLIESCVEIGYLKDEHSIHDCPYSAPARLDLVIRFGLLGCSVDLQQAQLVKNLIPEHALSDAYSFALQNAVEHNHLDMARYCLENKARPISPDEMRWDYREDSPIELAFAEGTPEMRNLLLSQLDKERDAKDLKILFLDEERWEIPPKEIIDFLGLSQTSK